MSFGAQSVKPRGEPEEIARQLAPEDRIRQGLIAVFTALEPCQSDRLHQARQNLERPCDHERR